VTAVEAEPTGNPAQLVLFDLISSWWWPNSHCKNMRLNTEVLVDEPGEKTSESHQNNNGDKSHFRQLRRSN